MAVVGGYGMVFIMPVESAVESAVEAFESGVGES